MARARGSPAEMETVTLAFLAAQEEPVGSPRLREALAEAGIDVAEATVGRFLRALDRQGYTEPVKYTRGRVITPGGRERLATLLRERRRGALSVELDQAISADVVTSLLDLLYARRGVEAEATRLAAHHATEREIANIAALATQHVRSVGGGGDAAEITKDFHLAVNAASHNGVLTAVATFLLDPFNESLVNMLDRINIEAGEMLQFSQDHERIARHLRAREAEQAERAMREHLDKIIAAVEEYFASMPPEAAAPAHPARP